MKFSRHTFCIYDCSTGEGVAVKKTPFKIGSGDGCDLKLNDSDLPEEYCVLYKKEKKTFLVPADGVGELILSGTGFTGGELSADQDYTLAIGSHLLAIRGATNPKKWMNSLDWKSWFIFDKTKNTTQGPLPLGQLAPTLTADSQRLDSTIVYCQGLTVGFYVEHVLSQLKQIFEHSPQRDVYERDSEDRSTPRLVEAPESLSATINAEYGEFTCPVCWLKFDRGDVMHIAIHGSLRGDPILGDEQMQRFSATRFNDRGQALDAMGIPTTDFACPHCRRKLPASFLDTFHYIFSIVGAPSSGKSYYLSVLARILQTSLYKNFGVSFRDADPSENVILNHMKNQLFSATTAEEAFLAKTELDGSMYEILPRLGRKVPLPKPFIFRVSNTRDPSNDFSVVFYDNAGEHFEPTRNSAESPGAQHIAAASGIFFLFDPLHNTEFRHRLSHHTDPQLISKRTDQQDVILAETEVRIKNLLGLDVRQRISTPLAMIIGKCDAWIDMLGKENIQNPVENGRLHLGKIEQNSKLVRDLLLDVCPAVVANAESISSDVMFFPASPLGCSPQEFTDSRGITFLAPDPKNIRPMYVDIPTLWVLSRIEPRLVPSFK